MHRFPRVALMILLLLLLAGCTGTRVHVDTRVSSDQQDQQLLLGPGYYIEAPEAKAQASLAFEDYADQVADTLRWYRPKLERVAKPEQADFRFMLMCQIIDRGTAVESTPVYGPRFGLMPYYSSGWSGGFGGYGYVGTEVRTVDLGYRHVLQLVAYVPDADKPAGQRVLWEGHAEMQTERRSLKQTMPSLTVALLEYFSQETPEPVHVAIDPDDPRLKAPD
jgi:hypothetical protein